MIYTSLFLASIGFASAMVVTPGSVARSSSRAMLLRMSDPRRDNMVEMEVRDVRDVVADGNSSRGGKAGKRKVSKNKKRKVSKNNDEPSPFTPPKFKAPQMSQSLPFVKCPPTLDGSMAGDVGFDPIGFSKSLSNLENYREAEIKHARLAMLAAAGWPLSELWDAKIANMMDLQPVLDVNGRVPSVLNGGMGKISVTYWLGCIVLAAGIDVYASFFASKKEGYIAGDLGFDPLNFYPKGAKGQKRMQLSEIKHGRWAMLAITAFAAQEFIGHIAVVDQTPLFFRPINEVLMGVARNSVITPDIAAHNAIEAVTSAAKVAPQMVPPLEAVTSAAVQATAVAPEVVAPTVVEAITTVAPTAAIESISAVPLEVIPAAPVEAAAATLNLTPLPVAPSSEEMVAAQSRIAELEGKLAQIESLFR